MLERPLLGIACLIVAFVLEGGAVQVAPCFLQSRRSSLCAQAFAFRASNPPGLVMLGGLVPPPTKSSVLSYMP